MDDADWSEWQLHDGKGCPCVGQFVHVIEARSSGVNSERMGRAGSEGGASWDWTNAPRCTRIIRFRIRTPRALADLRALIADQPVVLV